jgi:aryl-alcohol dehydrogenase-like predicted oxidoreductase
LRFWQLGMTLVPMPPNSHNPRFMGENFSRNLRIVEEAVVAGAGGSTAKIAPAWLLAGDDDVAPMPGSRRVACVEENTAVDGVGLSQLHIDRLNRRTTAAGDRHDEANMARIER